MEKLLEKKRKILIYIIIIFSFVFLIGESSNSEIIYSNVSERKELMTGNNYIDFDIEDNFIESINKYQHSFLRVNIPNINNVKYNPTTESIYLDKSKIIFYWEDGNEEYGDSEATITNVLIKPDDSCQANSNINKCNAKLQIVYDDFHKWDSDKTIKKIKFLEGFITYENGNLSKAKEQKVNINIDSRELLLGVNVMGINNNINKLPVTPISTYGNTIINVNDVILRKTDGNWREDFNNFENWEIIPNYKLGTPIKENGGYALTLKRIGGGTTTYGFSLDIPEITILDTKQTIYENEEFNLHLYIYDSDKIKNIDSSKIKISNLDKYNIVSDVCNDCGKYNYVLTLKNLNTNGKKVTIDKVELEEGFIVYEDSALSSNYIKDSGIEITVNPVKNDNNAITTPSKDNNQEETSVNNPRTGIYSIGFMIIVALGTVILLIVNNKKLNIFKKL